MCRLVAATVKIIDLEERPKIFGLYIYRRVTEMKEKERKSEI